MLRTGPGCMDPITILRQLLESRFGFQWPVMVVSLDIHATCDSNGRSGVWDRLFINETSQKCLLGLRVVLSYLRSSYPLMPPVEYGETALYPIFHLCCRGCSSEHFWSRRFILISLRDHCSPLIIPMLSSC